MEPLYYILIGAGGGMFLSAFIVGAVPWFDRNIFRLQNFRDPLSAIVVCYVVLGVSFVVAALYLFASA